MPPEVATKSDKTRRGAGKRYVRETDGQDSSDEDGDRRAVGQLLLMPASAKHQTRKLKSRRFTMVMTLPHGKSFTSHRISEIVRWRHLASKKPSSSA